MSIPTNFQPNSSQSQALEVFNASEVEHEHPGQRQIAMTMLRVLLPTIIFFGTIGNLLTFAVLVRRSMRTTPTFLYLTVLALADTAVLYLSGFKSWIRIMTGYELLHSSDVGCRLMIYVLLCACFLSSWLIVFITADRFIVVFFPFNAYTILRIRQARIAVVCLVFVVALCNLHVFWSFRLSVDESGRSTCDSADDDWFMNEVFEYLKLVTYSVIPFIIVLIFNICLIVRINGRTNAFTSRTPRLRLAQLQSLQPFNPTRRQLCSCSSASSTMSTQVIMTTTKVGQRRLTRMLLLVSFAWLGLTAPFTLHALFFDSAPSVRSLLVKSICFMLMYINHATNFYLYCITGQRFRDELKKILPFRWIRDCSKTLRRLSLEHFPIATAETPPCDRQSQSKS